MTILIYAYICTDSVVKLLHTLTYDLQHAKALVANNEFHPIQAAAAQPLEEADPAGLVFFHALGSTKNLSVSVLIDRNRHQNSHIFKLSTPVAAQVDPIHTDIWIASANLQYGHTLSCSAR